MKQRFVIWVCWSIGLAIGSGASALAGEPAPGGAATQRLILRATDADRDVIEEACRKRRLFQRRFAAEVYSLPPAYEVVPAPVFTPPPSSAEPATLPMPAAKPTYRYDGGPSLPPRQDPPSSTETASPRLPAFGPSPGERIVSQPRPPVRGTFPAYGERRSDDTVLLKGTRR